MERYRHNQRLKAVIVDVRDPSSVETNTKGHNTRPLIVVSRTHPDFIRRLFEMEVPEIYEGIVEIKERATGEKSSIAISEVVAKMVEIIESEREKYAF